MFHLVSYKCFRLTNVYQNLGDFSINGDFTCRVTDYEELGDGFLQEMMGMPQPRVLVFEVVIA